jgi:hypothetical protein
MSPTEVTIKGTLKPDGTLELSQRPPLPAGPVEVLIRSVPVSGQQENWWQYLQRVRAELEATGHPFRSKEEIDAEMEELRSGDERLEEIYRQRGGGSSQEESKGC